MARKKEQADKIKQRNVRDQIDTFKKDYPGAELAGVIPGNETGQYQLIFRPKLATLDPFSVIGAANVPTELQDKFALKASQIYRDPLTRQDLDLLMNAGITNQSPQKLYAKMWQYYFGKDIFGSFVNTMVNLAMAGFENDCENLQIKEFYDNWCVDIDIRQVLEWIFQEFYITGFVRTYKVLGKYEPLVNNLSPVKNPPQPKGLPKRAKGDTDIEFAERKKRWSKGFIPLAYTVLNPLEIEIKGSIFLNQTRVVMNPNEEMSELVSKAETTTPLTDFEKTLLDDIPPEIKNAMKSQKSIELDPAYVGEIDYRRMPYQKYPIPPYAKAMEVIEYKDRLRDADYSTLDNITTEILVVTVGDKDNPVTDDNDLRKVAAMFQTAQKAYAVVWNHTLKVQRLEVQNVDKILGPGKYQQAETDLSAIIGLPRALLDGVTIGASNKDALGFAIKATIKELEYGRNQVARFLYGEYQQIAEAFGFDQFPSIRWDDSILRDELAIMTAIQGLVDRRIISYHTAHKKMKLDPEYEIKMLTEEMPLVKAGKIGIIGSPYQQNKGGDGGGGGTQPTQKAPKGSPSEGRPKNKPGAPTPSKPSPSGPVKQVIKRETKHVKEEIRKGTLAELKKMSFEDLAELEKMLRFAKHKKAEELVNLVEETAEENLEDYAND